VVHTRSTDCEEHAAVHTPSAAVAVASSLTFVVRSLVEVDPLLVEEEAVQQ
jgi:hypothetical protein